MSNALIAVAFLIAQQSSPASGADLTRMLNGAPPSAVAAAPRPAPAASAPLTVTAPAPRSTGPTPVPVTTSPVSAPTRAPAPVRVPTAAPVQPAATPRPAPTPRSSPVATNAPVTAPPAAASTAATSPAPPPAAPLSAAAIAALPFRVSLPDGFTITEGRPGPDFDVYSIRRGGQPFVMIYAGPASQFPLYSGEMVNAGGRASIVTTEDGRRVALEHLFARQTAPAEVHVWITSVEGADRALAERIGQSVDVR